MGEIHIIPSCDSGQEDTEDVTCVEGTTLLGGCIGEHVAVTWNCAWTTDESASLTITASREKSDMCEMATVLLE